MTYYELCRQYVQEFLDKTGEPNELIYQLMSVINVKHPNDEWDALIR